jgi:hypothetical protein
VTPGPTPRYAPPSEHLELIVPGARIPKPRARHRGLIPPWPATMIAPSESELTRWAELWRNPQATQWGQAGHEHAVAALVRAELRCGPRRPSTWARVEVDRLRAELGLGHN